MADPVGEAIQRAKAHMLNEVWRPDLEEAAKRTIELLETLRATDDDNVAAKTPLEVATEKALVGSLNNLCKVQGIIKGQPVHNTADLWLLYWAHSHLSRTHR